MSYFILPKNKNIINVNPIDSSSLICKPYISYSLFYYYNQLIEQINLLCLDDKDISQNFYEEISRVVNPYEYVFTRVPGSQFSVSKLKPKTSMFYDFFEIATTLNIFDFYKSDAIKSLHITPNHCDTVDCLEMLRENFSDDVECYEGLNDEIFRKIGYNKYEFMFFDTIHHIPEVYMYSLIEYIMIILRNQNYNGCCVIKLSYVFHKPVVDILYFLSSLFDKVYIIKPTTNNITTFDRYVVCKNFLIGQDKINYLKLNYFRLLVFLKKLDKKNILSILNFDIPYYFTVKLDDMNIITGQPQLEALNLIINILRNKNKEEKIDMIKKSNIQKAVNWCEKYKIPCNKFSEKTNIFLPTIKDISSNTSFNPGVNTCLKDSTVARGFESQEFTNILQEYSSKDFSGPSFISPL